jgi:NAD(P)H-dependent flavin oxidoreductase YrpB (nitropropane dioxygenase family)
MEDCMFRTRVTDLLGIKYPIIEGGMTMNGNGELAAAVSNGGGLGVIATNPGWSDKAERVETVRRHIRRARELTDKPLGANLTLLFFDEYAKSQVAMLIEEKIDVVTTSGGSPKHALPLLKAAGIKTICIVSNVKQALAVQAAGADIIACEGYEAGGLEGLDELTTMVLTPMVVDAVDIPVISAGGIGDGRAFMAALALGAEGVQMGSAFITTTECNAHQRTKEAIVASTDTATLIMHRSRGVLSRVLKTEFTKKVHELDRLRAEAELQELMGSGQRVDKDNPAAFNRAYRGQMMGDLETGYAAVGQVAGLLREIKPAAQLIADIIAEAEAIANRWATKYATAPR